MFRFAHPYYFLLLIPAGVAAWLVYRRRNRPGVLFAPLHRIPAGHLTWQTWARFVAPALFLLGLVLTIIALARPQVVFSRITRQTDAIAIEMVVDTSGSMQALDFSTRETYRSRLDAVKETFAGFVDKRPDDLIGLVTFGGFVYSRVPLTLDHQALLHTLKGVEIPKPVFDANGNVVNAGEDMTALGDGLLTACARLQPSELKSKIAVLLTDGVWNIGTKPDAAMKAAKALGIRIYTIGVGSNGQAPFLMGKDAFGRPVIAPADVQLDEATLREIARTTNGRYFNVRDPGGLKQAMADINKLEKTKVNQEIYQQYNELFPRVLIPAIVLVLLAAAMNIALSKSVV